MVLIQNEIRDRNQVVGGRRSVKWLGAGEEPVQIQRIVFLIQQFRRGFVDPIDPAGFLVPQLANLGFVVGFARLTVLGQALGAFIGRDLATNFFAKPLNKRLAGHIDPTPDSRYLFPSACRRMPKILPVNVVSGGAFVLNFFRLFFHTSGLVLDVAVIFFLNVLSDLPSVFWHVLLLDMRVIPHPGHTAPAKEPILNRVLHSSPKIGVMLNFVVQSPLNEQGRHPANRVVIAKPAAYIGFGHPREHCRH